MLEVTNVQVYNLPEALKASGNAMRTEPVASDVKATDKDVQRCIKLTKAGFSDVSCHSNYLTGILVSFDVKYPQYWSMEAQRYHWFNIVTSASKMHRLLKMDIKNCCNEYTNNTTISNLKEFINQYNRISEQEDGPFIIYPEGHDIVGLTPWMTEDKQDALYKAFMFTISNCPMGLELFEHVTTNYKQLQTIYFQRRNHKLKEDWGPFCKMIESLPYFKELILGEKG